MSVGDPGESQQPKPPTIDEELAAVEGAVKAIYPISHDSASLARVMRFIASRFYPNDAMMRGGY
jgi:hypothetical protein